MVICSFVSDDGTRRFATYTLDTFDESTESSVKDRRLNSNDPNFIDESNVLDFVSDGCGSYFSQLHLIDTL